MEISVKTDEIEEMSGEVRILGSRLDEVISSYNTVSYEILNEMEPELEEEIKLSMEEVKKRLEESFLTLKKHESFLIDTYTLYEDTERRVTADSADIGVDLYMGGDSLQMMPIVPQTTVFPAINPTIFTFVVPKLPDSKVSRLDLKVDREGIIIKKFRDSIISGIDNVYDMEMGFRALSDLLLPGTVSAGLITDLFSVFADQGGYGEENGFGGSSEGGFSSLYEKFVWLVGQAFQANYYMIKPEYFEFILEGIVNGALFWAGLNKYDKLSDAEHLKGVDPAGNVFSGKDDNDEEAKEKSNDDLKDMAATAGGAYGYMKAKEKDEEEQEEKYAAKNFNIEGSYCDEGEEAEVKNYDGFYSGGINSTAYDENEESGRHYTGGLYGGTSSNADMYNTYQKKDKYIDKVLSMSHKDPTNEETTHRSGGGFLGGGLYSGSVSSSDGDEIPSTDMAATYTSSKQDVPVTNSSKKTEYNKSNIFYDRILYSALGGNQSAKRPDAYFAAAGAATILGGIGGASGAGIVGSVGNFAMDSIGDGISKYIPSLIGVLNVGNIMDVVGKAQLCSLDWLGELNNILT